MRSAGVCTLNVRGVFTSTSSRNCKQTRDLKSGIRGRLRNSSPLVSLLDKRVYKFKVEISKIEICYFTNFKIPFTRKNWLLKFSFAYSSAQILEPKLLVHEILKFVRHLFDLIKKFANFKTLLTRLSRLLNLGLVATRH